MAEKLWVEDFRKTLLKKGFICVSPVLPRKVYHLIRKGVIKQLFEFRSPQYTPDVYAKKNGNKYFFEAKCCSGSWRGIAQALFYHYLGFEPIFLAASGPKIDFKISELIIKNYKLPLGLIDIGEPKAPEVLIDLNNLRELLR